MLVKRKLILAVLFASLFFIYQFQENIRHTFTWMQVSEMRVQASHNEVSLKMTPLFSYLPKSPISKDLVVHSAYFDDRARDNHDNVTVIFIDINQTILDSGWILGCGVDSIKAVHFLVHSVAENKLMHAWLGPKPFLYETMVIMCYDLPVQMGNEVFVIYKTSTNTDDEVIVMSPHPIVFPAPRVQPIGEYNFTVVTCTKAHDRNVTWIQEFIRYQKTIGVDHVHISILDTFIKDGGFKDRIIADPFMREALNNSYLSFSVWQEWYDGNMEVYLHSEILRKLSCMYRFRGTYDYAFSLDTDDFFTPRIPSKTNVKYYIKKYCYIKPAASCAFKWTWYAPKCGMIGEIGLDGNVTNHLDSYQVYRNNKLKSVHNTQALVDATFHDAACNGCLLPGYDAVYVPQHVAHVAHNRMNLKHHC